ncbi:MAG: molybdenum cofactor guanylyltransferase MobA [Pseudomonadota bacterium]
MAKRKRGHRPVAPPEWWPEPARDVVGVLLAGGQSRRMGGGDKGLKSLGGTPMLATVSDRLRRQTGALVLNANGDETRFATFDLPVVADPVEDHPGPLAGVLAGLGWAAAHRPEARYIATVSTDAPFIPPDLVARLAAALDAAPDARIAMARSGGQLHPVIGLWPVALADDLAAALAAGTRKVLAWTDTHGTAAADFAPVLVNGHLIDPFFNVNTPDELGFAEAILKTTGAIQPPPAYGVVGWKSSGKTTLTAALIAELRARGLTVHSMKHAHHAFRVDEAQTDSARHRKAGASRVGLTSGRRTALITEDGGARTDAGAFNEMLTRMGPADILIVEGFKRAPIPKIEARRRGASEATPIAETDPHVIAIATDDPGSVRSSLPVVSLDAVARVADLILAHRDAAAAAQHSA